VQTGTLNSGGLLTLPTTLTMLLEIGAKAKRLAYLGGYWIGRIECRKLLKFGRLANPACTPESHRCRISDRTRSANNNAIVTKLHHKFGILTLRRSGVSKGHCVRVSPALLYTTEADLDKPVFALDQISKRLMARAEKRLIANWRKVRYRFCSIKRASALE
jgi:selenocysteine lyase/cysteine desulfurase